jgi:hypothetical protein
VPYGPTLPPPREARSLSLFIFFYSGMSYANM